MQRNAISWFEIPVLDLDRAQHFYETLLGHPLRREAMGPSQGAVWTKHANQDNGSNAAVAVAGGAQGEPIR